MTIRERCLIIMEKCFLFNKKKRKETDKKLGETRRRRDDGGRRRRRGWAEKGSLRREREKGMASGDLGLGGAQFKKTFTGNFQLFFSTKSSCWRMGRDG